MGTLDYLSDNLIELRGPVNVATNAAFPTLATTSSCAAKLYDTALDARLAKFGVPMTADAEAGATSVFVNDTAPIFIGSVILIDMNNGQEDRETVTAVDSGTGEVTFSGGSLSDNAFEGNMVTLITYDSTSTVISIDNFGQWEDGMNMEITLDDGTQGEFIVSLIDPDSGYLTLNAVLGVDTQHGALIKRKIGADIGGFADFGSFPASDPVPGDRTWGFRSTIASDHADIQLGMRIRGEITADDGSGLNITRKVIAAVIKE